MTTRPKPPKACPESPSGRHHLAPRITAVVRLDQPGAPTGWTIYTICRFCGKDGTAFVPEDRIAWEANQGEARR